MDLQKMFDNAVEASRAEQMKTSKQFTVGELILKLEMVKKNEKGEDKQVRFDFANLRPTGLNSYRGTYREIAFGFDEETNIPTVSEVITWLKEAIGKTYTGYKGGNFVMGKNTPVWVANYGNSNSDGISGIKEDDWTIYLLTEKF
jgi:hypothetical protein